jgi:hypothetical protein
MEPNKSIVTTAKKKDAVSERTATAITRNAPCFMISP